MKNSEMRRYVISSIVTFISVFLLVLGAQFGSANTLEWTWAMLWAMVATALRVAVKAAVESVINK